MSKNTILPNAGADVAGAIAARRVAKREEQLADYLWQRTHLTQTQIDHVVDFCLAGN